MIAGLDGIHDISPIDWSWEVKTGVITKASVLREMRMHSTAFIVSRKPHFLMLQCCLLGKVHKLRGQAAAS